MYMYIYIYVYIARMRFFGIYVERVEVRGEPLRVGLQLFDYWQGGVTMKGCEEKHSHTTAHYPVVKPSAVVSTAVSHTPTQQQGWGKLPGSILQAIAMCIHICRCICVHVDVYIYLYRYIYLYIDVESVEVRGEPLRVGRKLVAYGI